MHLTGLEILSKYEISLDLNTFRNAVYSTDPELKMHNRKLYLRGFTHARQLASLSRLVGSKKKASKILISFTESFWKCFYEWLWKFRCEVMANWEKENNISVKEKKRKQKKRHNSDKENTSPEVTEKETKVLKEARIQKEASS